MVEKRFRWARDRIQLGDRLAGLDQAQERKGAVQHALSLLAAIAMALCPDMVTLRIR